MNADRLWLAVAALISIVVHGAIALFGDFSGGGRAATTSRFEPVSVTIASIVDGNFGQAVVAATPPNPKQEPRRQESNSDVAEAAETDLSIPATAIPAQEQPTESSKSELSSDDSQEPNSSEPVETRPPPLSRPDQSSPNEALVSTSANRSNKTSVTGESNHAAQAAVSRLPTMPEIPDVTAMPLYYLIPKPLYPSRSRDLGEEGLVIIAVLVNKDGSVLEAYVSESSGYPLLDGSALATVTENWRFKPGTRRGNAVSSWVRVPIKFSIKGSQSK